MLEVRLGSDGAADVGDYFQVASEVALLTRLRGSVTRVVARLGRAQGWWTRAALAALADTFCLCGETCKSKTCGYSADAELHFIS